MDNLDQGGQEPGAEVTADPINETAGYVDTSTSPDDSIESTESEPSLLEETSDDDEEIDYEGEKYKVPAKLKDAFLRQQDYTTKTMTLAEQRKEVEARQSYLEQQAQIQQQNLAEYAELHALDSQLSQLKNVDWNALIDSDPVQAMKLQQHHRALIERRNEVASTVTQKQEQASQAMQRETDKRMAEGSAVLSREIKGWSPEVAQGLVSFGKEIGFTLAELKNISDPRAVKLLHKAWQFDQLLKKQATAKPVPAPQEKPVTRITASKGTAPKDPSKMTDQEFAAMRRRQIAQRA